MAIRKELLMEYKLIRLTTVLGLNDKCLIYLTENRIEIYWKEFSNICKPRKKEKEAFHHFIELTHFVPVMYLLC